MAWLKAVYNASMNTSGGLVAGPQNKSFFYTAIRHRQRSAFGPFGFKTPDWSKFDAADYPWALPEPIFRKLDADVEQDKGLAGEKAVSWKDVTDTVAKYKTAIGLSTPAGVLGKKLFKSFLVKYAPELAEGAVAEWGAVAVSTVAFGAVALQEVVVPIHNAQVKRAFKIDRQRRDYDMKVGNVVALR